MTDSTTDSNSFPKSIIQITGLSLILGFLADLVFFDQRLGLNLFILTLAYQITLFGFQLRKQNAIHLQTWLISLGILILSITPVFRADPYLTFFNFLGLFGLILIQLKSFLNFGLFNPFMSKMTTVFIEIPVRLLESLFTIFIPESFKLFSFSKFSGINQKRFGFGLLGLFISLPILLVFGLLFASADPKFGELFAEGIFSFLNFSFFSSGFWQIITILFFTAIFGSSLAFVYASKDLWKDQQATFPVKVVSGVRTIINTVFLLVNALFGLFIFVQIKYFFGGNSNIKIDGFTYADYARRGFVELLIVAIFSFILIKLGEYLVVRFSQNYSRSFQILAGLWITQVLVIAMSAYQRVSMYEQAYGLTYLRLYSQWGIVFIGVVFAVYFAKVLFRYTNNIFPQILLWLSMFSLVLINILNPTGLIANDVWQIYKGSGKVDLEHLRSLSLEAHDEQMRILDEDLQPGQIVRNNQENNSPTKIYSENQKQDYVCNLHENLVIYGQSDDVRSFTIFRSQSAKDLDKINTVIKQNSYDCSNYLTFGR